MDAIGQILSQVDAEVRRAQAKHGPMRGAHEAYAVILEELDEVWDEVKRQRPAPEVLRKELTQVAAMAIRALHDLKLINT